MGRTLQLGDSWAGSEAGTMIRLGLRWDMIHSRKADLSGKEGFGKEQGLFTAPVNRLRRGRLGYLCNGLGRTMQAEAERR